MTAGKLLRGALGLGVFGAFWETAPRAGWIDAQFAPPLSKVLRAVFTLLADGTLVPHLEVSLWRAAAGLVIAAAVAVPAGLALGAAGERVNRAIEPLLRIFGQVNPFSLMPLFLLFFGLGEVAHVAVMAWVSLWPILRHTVGGVRSVDRAILRSARSMGVHGPAWLFGVLLPAAAHSIFTGVRAGGGLLFFMLIGAEMIGAGAGLGWFLHNAAANYQITRIYAAGILILVCGALLDAALAAFERRVPFRIGPRGMGAAGLALAVIVIVTAPAIRAMDRANAQVMTGHPSCHETHNQPEPTPDDLERLSKELTGAH